MHNIRKTKSEFCRCSFTTTQSTPWYPNWIWIPLLKMFNKNYWYHWYIDIKFIFTLIQLFNLCKWFSESFWMFIFKFLIKVFFELKGSSFQVMQSKTLVSLELFLVKEPIKVRLKLICSRIIQKKIPTKIMIHVLVLTITGGNPLKLEDNLQHSFIS